MSNLVIPSVQTMDDQTLIRHLELRHKPDLRLEFRTEPGRTEPRLHAPREWRTYHDTLHRLYPNNYDHEHREG